jgi:hypothetical protein
MTMTRLRQFLSAPPGTDREEDIQANDLQPALADPGHVSLDSEAMLT